MKLPATLKPENVTALIDTREQQLLDLSPLRTEQATLPTGDYSLKGLEHVVAIERKSLDDLLGVVGRDRPRFDREVQRLLAYPSTSQGGTIGLSRVTFIWAGVNYIAIPCVCLCVLQRSN